MEDDIDGLIDDLQGHRLYALGAINEGARWASIGLQTALEVAGAILGVDVFWSVAEMWRGKGGFMSAMNIVATVNPLGRLGGLAA